MELKRGMRDKLDKYVNLNGTIEVEMNVTGHGVYDFCCFGVDASDKLSDDRYMIFYNQTISPQKEITYRNSGNSAFFSLNLSRLPMSIQKLIFTVSIDGNSTMGDISNHSFCIKQSGNSMLKLHMNGADFKQEKAIITVELYRKDTWRINAVARGFNGGLSELLKNYGGVEASSSSLKQILPQISGQLSETLDFSAISQKVSLKKGQKINLLKNNCNIIIENGWTASGKDYDLKALVRYRNGKLMYIGAANSDEYLQTPEGAVRHCGDVRLPGELEQIEIHWNSEIASVAVSSYSALENGTGSFKRYGVYVRIKNGNQIIEIPASDTSANDKSYTLCFGEILFGNTPGEMTVSALEMYSKPGSENRIGYNGDKIQMDIGPVGQIK